MKPSHGQRKSLSVLGLVLVAILVVSMACASPEPTATPVPPAQPAAPVAPPTPVATVAAPATPAPTAALPTPTRVLPTPTVVAVDKPVYGGTLRFISEFTFSANTLDPAHSRNTEERMPLKLVYDQLVELGPGGSYVPRLARSWDFSADGKSITFHLEKGVKFQDGTPLDAAAVKWNLDRYKDPKVVSLQRTSLIPVQKVEVVDEVTVRFFLNEPYRPLFADLTDRASLIASPSAVMALKSYDDQSGEFGRKPVGSGRFKLKEWTPGLRMIFERNEGYWMKGEPYLDRILVQGISDSDIRYAMLRTGETDFIDRIEDAAVGLAALKNPQLKVQVNAGTKYSGLKVRQTVPPFNNKDFRAAMAYAIDRKKVIDTQYGGQGVPAYSPVSPLYTAYYDPNFKPYEYNAQKARERLAAAGYSGEVSFALGCAQAPREITRCEVYQALLAAVGINMKLPPVENRVIAFRNGTINAREAGLNIRADVHSNLFTWYHSKGGSNVGDKHGYSNPEFDRIIDEVARVFDVAKARELYRRVIQIWAEDLPDIPILFENQYFLMSTKVQGFVPRTDNEPRLAEIWLSK